MSYEDIRIKGSLTEAMEAWVVRRYGKVVDIEMSGINEGDSPPSVTRPWRTPRLERWRQSSLCCSMIRNPVPIAIV